ncbi:MAG TPA: hypothetical protein V6D22_21165 [Candidatus Obscuribacterales bacterium]
MKHQGLFAALIFVVLFSVFWMGSVVLGLAPRDLDDLGFDWHRGYHVQRVSCGGTSYNLYGAGGARNTDRLVFTLRKPGNYTITFGPDRATKNGDPISRDQWPKYAEQLPKEIKVTVDRWTWFLTKVEVVQRLPQHFGVEVQMENLDPRIRSGEWACSGLVR